MSEMDTWATSALVRHRQVLFEEMNVLKMNGALPESYRNIADRISAIDEILAEREYREDKQSWRQDAASFVDEEPLGEVSPDDTNDIGELLSEDDAPEEP